MRKRDPTRRREQRRNHRANDETVQTKKNHAPECRDEDHIIGELGILADKYGSENVIDHSDHQYAERMRVMPCQRAPVSRK